MDKKLYAEFEGALKRKKLKESDLMNHSMDFFEDVLREATRGVFRDVRIPGKLEYAEGDKTVQEFEKEAERRYL